MKLADAFLSGKEFSRFCLKYMDSYHPEPTDSSRPEYMNYSASIFEDIRRNGALDGQTSDLFTFYARFLGRTLFRDLRELMPFAKHRSEMKDINKKYLFFYSSYYLH